MLSLSCCFPEAPLSPHPNLTTYTYQTQYGTVSLTWSRSMLGHSLHLQLHSAATFHLRIKPWNKKRGSKKLSHNTLFLWNLSHANFARGPHPISRFYLALLVDHSLTLLVGDQAPKPKPKPTPQPQQHLLLKRDHVHVAPHSTTVYQTATPLAGKVRDFRIDCHGHAHDDSLALVFRVDSHSVLHVTRLRWKFRGSQRLEIDGAHLHISWDVHDWLFHKDKDHLHQNAAAHGHAVFMCKFEDHQVAPPNNNNNNNNNNNKDLLVDPLTHHHWSLGSNNAKSWSSSSLSVSSGSFGGSSSVMEWSSVEENDLVVPLGFSLVVYAWRR
ncbi:hypothetical protein Fmac_031914 [Flemingia macrophylla]|uniref:Uncharacterized protein n=1 Tax=Flemingia macrophylla TaxID=520843 RepID=A0ABD1L3V1_9FABA